MIYLQLEENVETDKMCLNLSDIANLWGADPKTMKGLSTMKVYQFQDGEERVVLSAIGIIREIIQRAPGEEVTVLGATDVILEHIKEKRRFNGFTLFKIIGVCSICFFGTAFSIMAFHNDIGIQGLCEEIYGLVGLERSHTFPVLEIAYSIGLGGGIILFYNHVGKRRISKDPTPIEVEMRLYEKDVNDSIIETAKRLNREK